MFFGLSFLAVLRVFRTATGAFEFIPARTYFCTAAILSFYQDLHRSRRTLFANKGSSLESSS